MKLVAKASKLALLGALALHPAQWDAQSEAWSRLIPHDWPGSHARRLGTAVQAGEVKLLALKQGDERRGFLVYRIDAKDPRPEFTIVAAYSGVTRENVTALFLGEIETFARAQGCGTVRFNTMRPGLVRKAQAAGYRTSEIIMRKDLA